MLLLTLWFDLYALDVRTLAQDVTETHDVLSDLHDFLGIPISSCFDPDYEFLRLSEIETRKECFVPL